MFGDKGKKKKKSDPEKSDDELTPEERLFKVIASGSHEEDEDYERDDLGGQDAFSRIEGGLDRLVDLFSASVQGLVDLLKPGKLKIGRSIHLKWIAKYIRLRHINRGLMVLVILLFVYFLLDLVVFRLKPPTLKEDVNAPFYMLEKLDRYLNQPKLQVYVSGAKKRNVFAPYVKPKPARTEASGGQQQEAIPETLPVDVKLVGISWDAEEYVAMIEYPGELDVHFLREGDEIEDGIKVQRITENEVLFFRGESRWELA